MINIGILLFQPLFRDGTTLKEGFNLPFGSETDASVEDFKLKLKEHTIRYP